MLSTLDSITMLKLSALGLAVRSGVTVPDSVTRVWKKRSGAQASPPGVRKGGAEKTL